MATRQQAERALAALGLELAEGAGKQCDGSWHVNIDPVGRTSYAGDCRGHVVFDYTASAAVFWAEVIHEGASLGDILEPCPHPEGECDFHDA